MHPIIFRVGAVGMVGAVGAVGERLASRLILV
jgi:hypothetical protein